MKRLPFLARDPPLVIFCPQIIRISTIKIFIKERNL